MSVPVTEVGRVPQKAHPGRRLAIWSLLMVPVLLVLYAPLFFVGSALQSALGLADDEMLTEAGAWGVAAAALMLMLVAVPQIVGVVLGVKARRLGESRLGTMGIAVNVVIGAFIVLGSVVQLVLA